MKTKKKKIIVVAIIVTLLFSMSRVYGFSVGSLVDGFAGLLLYPMKAIPLLVGELLEIILGLFSGSGLGLTLEDIFFNQMDNRLPLVNVNFFAPTADMTEPIKTITENVALWYVGMRNIAIVLLVIIAVYVGIRMAMSTVAEEQAKYKNMLTDWLTSLALLFILHYIMILIIGINDTLVKVLYTAVQSNGSATDIANKLSANAWTTISFAEGMGNAIAFLLLEGMTFIFLITYIRRMITVAFLIIIAPLVTITYSIDKMKDGKSQALDTWLKEFSYNILIQPFHCVAYLALVSTAFDMLSNETNLKNAVIALLIMGFIYKAEDIVKAIFGFKSQSLGKSITDAAFATAMYKNMTTAGKNATNGLNKYKEAKAPAGKKNNKAIQTKDVAEKPETKEDDGLTQDQRDELAAEGLTPEDQEYQQYAKQHVKTAPQNNNTQAKPSVTNNNNNDHNSNINAKTDPNDIEEQSGIDQDNKANNKKMFGSKVGGMVKKGLAKELKWGSAIALGTLGYSADEDIFKGAMTMGTAGYEMGKGLGNSLLRKSQERSMVKAFRNYQDEHPELTQKQLVKNGMDLLSGDRNADTEAEQNLREQLKRLQGLHADIGEKDPDKVIKKEMNDAYEGRISEVEKPLRFTGSRSSFHRNTSKSSSTSSTSSSETNSTEKSDTTTGGTTKV